MPKYKVKPESFGLCAPSTAEATEKDKKHYPTVYFPASKEILGALTPGEEVTVTLKGKVKRTELRESDNSKDTYNNKAEITMEIYEVEAYGEGEFEKLSKDDDE